MPVRPTLSLSPEDAATMLLGLQAVDMRQMERAGPSRPRVRELIASGRLRYSRVDPSEHWQSYQELVEGVARKGIHFADCEDLATATAAEMAVDFGAPDFDPQARPHVYKSAPRVSHVVVSSPRFGYLDPSITAGMGWNE